LVLMRRIEHPTY